MADEMEQQVRALGVGCGGRAALPRARHRHATHTTPRTPPQSSDVAPCTRALSVAVWTWSSRCMWWVWGVVVGPHCLAPATATLPTLHHAHRHGAAMLHHAHEHSAWQCGHGP